MTHTIEINMDKNCKRCGRGGATQSGYCLKCITKNLKEGKYKHIIEKHKHKLGSYKKEAL